MSKLAEEKLRRQSDFTDALTNSLGEGVYALDREGLLTFMNPAAEKMLGWKEAELLGRNMHDCVHFQRADGTPLAAGDCPLLGVIESSITISSEDDVFTRRDGTSFPVTYTSSPIITGGEVMGAVLAFRDTTERKRAERNLSAQYAVARSLAESATLSEATPKILQAICESLGWELGALWNVDRQLDALRCVEIWHAPAVEVTEFEELCKQSAMERGEGFPGRVWQNGEHLWVTDIASGGFLRSAAAADTGLHGAFGFPIRIEGEIVGVMEFFSRQVQPPDTSLLNMLETFSSQIGQFIERKVAEEAQRESEERFRTLAETATDAIVTIDETSRITYINHAAENIFGYTVAEMNGSDLTMLMPDYLRHLHNAGLKRYVDTGRKHIPWDGVELPGLHKQGHEIPVEISFSEFMKNGERFFTGIVRDISERKRTQEALRKSEEQYRLMTEAMPPQVWTARTDGGLDYVNQRVLDYFGRTMEEMLGAGWQHVVHPDDLPSAVERWTSALRTGETYQVEFRLKRAADESYRWHLGRAMALRDQEGQIIKWLGTNTDIEEQKQLEATLARINREREQMLEEVSTPVVPVWRGVLALPIIGSLDTERMQRATDAALGEVMRTGARACIIDITGARLVDTLAVANLTKLVAALKLVGAEAIVTGVTAQAARSLVGLGIDFKGMRTYRTLAEALASLIKSSKQIKKGEYSSNGTSKKSGRA